MEIFDSYADEFIAKFQRISKIVKHGPSIGSYHEMIIRSFLSKYLVRKFSVRTGFVSNIKKGTISKQIDIIIVDETFPTAYLFREDDFAIVNSEAVVCGIEIKSTLNKKDFNDIVEKAIDYNHIVQGHSFLAFTFDTRSKKILDSLRGWYEERTDIVDIKENYFNTLYVLNRGYLRLIPESYTGKWGHYFIRNSNASQKIGNVVVSDLLATVAKFCEIRGKIAGNPYLTYSADDNYVYLQCYRFGKVEVVEKVERK